MQTAQLPGNPRRALIQPHADLWPQVEHTAPAPNPTVGGCWPQPRGGLVLLRTWDSQDTAQSHPSDLCKPWSPSKISSQAVGHTIIYSCLKKRERKEGMFRSQKCNFSTPCWHSQNQGSSPYRALTRPFPLLPLILIVHQLGKINNTIIIRVRSQVTWPRWLLTSQGATSLGIPRYPFSLRPGVLSFCHDFSWEING